MGGTADGETASAISIDHVGPVASDDGAILTARKAGKDILFGSVSLFCVQCPLLFYLLDLSRLQGWCQKYLNILSI